MKCNLCGGTRFIDIKKRRSAKCASCSALERTRLLWMHIVAANLPEDARILHFAPERGLYHALRQHLPHAHYETADVNPERYSFARGIRMIDLCKLDDEPTGSYDLILHSHVLEHVPCAMAYTLMHLSRMLKKTGWQICVIPFLPGHFDETYAEIGAKERIRRFGQHDHIRRIGVEDRDAHLGRIIRLPKEYDAEARFGSDALNEANIPESIRRGFTVHTVLELSRNDYQLYID